LALYHTITANRTALYADLVHSPERYLVISRNHNSNYQRPVSQQTNKQHITGGGP